MILIAYLVLFIDLAVLEFSFSGIYADNQYLSIVTFKLFNMFLELMLNELIRENLLVSPVMVLSVIIELLITLGAVDFTDFVVAYYVELSLGVAERLFIDPLIKSMQAYGPLYGMNCKRMCRRNRAIRTRAERKADEEQYRSALETVYRETESVEPILDSYLTYSNNLAGLLLSPAIQVFLLITDTTGIRVTQIPELYEIRSTDLFYYTIFAVVIIPATMAMDIFLMNALELIHGWKIYDFLVFQDFRFSVREKRWQMNQKDFDTSVSGPL